MGRIQIKSMSWHINPKSKPKEKKTITYEPNTPTQTHILAHAHTKFSQKKNVHKITYKTTMYIVIVHTTEI